MIRSILLSPPPRLPAKRCLAKVASDQAMPLLKVIGTRRMDVPG